MFSFSPFFGLLICVRVKPCRTRRSDERPPNESTVTATKTRHVAPRPVMITLPSSPSPQNTPDSARRRSSSLGSMSPTANSPHLNSPHTATSQVKELVSRSAAATPAVDLRSEDDPDERSLTSELSDFSDDPDFQRRVEERGQKRVILRELTARERNSDGLNEEEQALLSELRRAQEIETAAQSGGAHGLFEVEKIETTDWERYKERSREEARTAEEDHPTAEGRYNEDGQVGGNPLDGEGGDSESEMGRQPSHGKLGLSLTSTFCNPKKLIAERLSSLKLKHRDSFELRQRSTSVSAEAYSQPSRSHGASSSTPKTRPVSSALQ